MTAEGELRSSAETLGQLKCDAYSCILIDWSAAARGRLKANLTGGLLSSFIEPVPQAFDDPNNADGSACLKDYFKLHLSLQP